jgi:hypothetical protein
MQGKLVGYLQLELILKSSPDDACDVQNRGSSTPSFPGHHGFEVRVGEEFALSQFDKKPVLTSLEDQR